MDMEKYHNPFKVKNVKDGDEFTLGLYVNRVPVFGLYIEGEENFIKELEIKAKSKFKLECDSENYAQEVRMYYFIMLEKYVKKFGAPKNEKEEKDMIKYVSKGCINKLKNLARGMKSKISYYDEEREEFVIQNLISIEHYKENEVSLDNLEYMICCQGDSNEESYNEFSNWFHRNKDQLLTKKQLEYLKDSTAVDRSNQKKIEKNIVKRIDKKYSNLTVEMCRVFELERKIEIIENILDSDTNEEMLKKIVLVLDSEDWLMDALYSGDFETCKILTEATKGRYHKNKKIYIISSILIKKLQELENFLLKYKEN